MLYRLAFIALLVSPLWLAGCGDVESTENGQQRLQPVSVTEARAGELSRDLRFSGVSRPADHARLTFQSSGILSTRPVILGQLVKKGEVLATLRNPDLEPAQQAASARLEETITRLEQARRDLKRLQDLFQRGAVGEERVEQQRSELEALEAAVISSRADLAGSSRRLDDSVLEAPFDGVVARLYVEPDEYVRSGDPVIGLGGLEALEVELRVPAAVVADLRHGDPVTVDFPQLDKAGLAAEITEIGAIGESDTGLFPVVVEVPVEEGLRAGMRTIVAFTEHSGPGVIVPLGAVVDAVGRQPKIYRLDGDRVYSVAVQPMFLSGDEVLVRGELSAGTQVVIAGHRSLTDGQRVESRL